MSLEVAHLSKKYGEKTALEDLSFTMEKPGVYALLGTNGAGKTTAIRMMLNMLQRDSGTVLWDGKPLDPETCNVGYLAEERGLYPKYELMDQLIYFGMLRGMDKETVKERIAYWAKRLEVEEYLYPEVALAMEKQREEEEARERGLTGLEAKETKGSRPVKKKKPQKADQLSKGNQQKIQFMIALLSDPQLIILDEPMSGLDPVNTDLFREIIHEEIEKGKYLIMSSHQMATVEEFCTDILILNRSKVILQGNLNEIKKSYGRIFLSLKVEEDISKLLSECGAQVLSEKEGEYELRVSGDEEANALLSRLIAAGVRIIRFDLREPSLHEIFVRKVEEAQAALHGRMEEAGQSSFHDHTQALSESGEKEAGRNV
ncbi:MAG: ATP-binding cassette domain-containing protein [Lachnospiraceae bacterium]|nr:ATP-binding cassette domain-containing protein [Lachnospiraceae bacterium]